MPADVSEQTAVFLASIASGIIIGIMYDAESALRRGFKTGSAAAFVLDCLFWCMAVIIFFCAIYLTCGGQVHWYAPVGSILGLALYMIALSRYILPPLSAVAALCRKVFMQILRRILFPIVKILKTVAKIFSPIRKFVKNQLKKQQNFVQKNLEKVRRFGILLNKH